MTKNRETIKSLIKASKIAPGTKVEMVKRKSEIVEAVITEYGTIQLSTGEVFNSPSSAARFVRNGVSTNGWRTWRLMSNGMALDSVRTVHSSN